MVSVLCTAYNHEKYIAQTLQCIVDQQTDFAFELLVNDDASTDGTAAIIREYAGREARFRVRIVQIAHARHVQADFDAEAEAAQERRVYAVVGEHSVSGKVLTSVRRGANAVIRVLSKRCRAQSEQGDNGKGNFLHGQINFCFVDLTGSKYDAILPGRQP